MSNSFFKPFRRDIILPGLFFLLDEIRSLPDEINALSRLDEITFCHDAIQSRLGEIHVSYCICSYRSDSGHDGVLSSDKPLPKTMLPHIPNTMKSTSSIHCVVKVAENRPVNADKMLRIKLTFYMIKFARYDQQPLHLLVIMKEGQINVQINQKNKMYLVSFLSCMTFKINNIIKYKCRMNSQYVAEINGYTFRYQS